MSDETRLWIGGAWQPSESGATVEARSPATGEALGRVAQGTRTDADRAVRAANAAAPALAALSPAERARLCHRIADAIAARREELARIVTLEQGKPYFAEALIEADEAAECFRLWGEEARRLESAVHPSSDPRKRIVTIRQPRGVYAIITPWNWPLTMPAEQLAPALAAGNAVVWVPAPSTSLCAVRLAECLEAAGLPPGAVNLLTGPGPVVGDAIAAHPDTHGVAFTGSIATGRQVAQRAAGKPVLLELGGNGPFVVWDDADLDRAAQAAALGAFLCAGQSCSAAERILVHRAIHAPFLERLVAAARDIRLGDPFDPATTMGPMNNAAVADKMERHVADARARGAKVLHGGRRAAGFPTPLYWEATVLDGVTPEMAVFREETFGPVAPVTAFSDEAELIELANQGPYGLVGAVFTRDLGRAFRLAERLRCGVVNVNESTNYWELHVPYGGVRQSGVGRIGGKYSLWEMTDLKTIVLDVG